jgi:anti-anti-sigma factor
MWIESLKDRTFVIYIAVSREPELQRELEILNKIVQSRNDCNVIISLANIEMLSSASLGHLVSLHNSLSEKGCKLILCRVSLPTKGVFVTAGLNTLFNFADDIFAAMTKIKASGLAESVVEHIKAG